MRLPVRQARCVRDDLTRGLSKSSEIDDRDLATFLEKGGYDGLGVQFGPPFVPVLFLFFVPACHGTPKCSPVRPLVQRSLVRTVPLTRRGADHIGHRE